MKDKDITALNVDDFMREKKKLGVKSIHWGKNGAKHFKNFAISLYELEYYKFPKSWFKGFLFMGLKHYAK